MELPQSTLTENAKLYSTCCTQIETHIYFLWGSFGEIPLITFAERLLILVSNLLSAFLIVATFLVQTETYQLNSLIALLNPNFIKVIKTFEKKVHQVTGFQLSLIHIKELLDESYLISLLVRFNALVFKRLKQSIRADVDRRFSLTSPFLEFEFLKQLTQLVQKFTASLSYIVDGSQVNELLFELYDAFLSSYYCMYIAAAVKMNLENYEKYTQKLAVDLKALQGFFEANKYPSSSQNLFKLQQLRVFHGTDQMDECIMAITNMQVFHAELCDMREIQKLMRAKFLYPKVLVSTIEDYLENALVAMQKQQRAQAFLDKIPVIYYVCTFKAKIRQMFLKRRADTPKVSRNFTLAGKKDTKIRIESRPSTFSHMYKAEGWTSILKFDAKIDDLDIEAHLNAE
jgi:hypothetical protein